MKYLFYLCIASLLWVYSVRFWVDQHLRRKKSVSFSYPILRFGQLDEWKSIQKTTEFLGMSWGRDTDPLPAFFHFVGLVHFESWGHQGHPRCTFTTWTLRESTTWKGTAISCCGGLLCDDSQLTMKKARSISRVNTTEWLCQLFWVAPFTKIAHEKISNICRCSLVLEFQ